MNKYEVLYILAAEQEAEAIAAQVEKFSKLVTENGGTIEEVNEWGKRRLAYPINYKNEGYYVLMNFVADAGFTTELERNFRIDENVVRYMTVRKD
jgi:small subunit ribosomal protein S6